MLVTPKLSADCFLDRNRIGSWTTESSISERRSYVSHTNNVFEGKYSSSLQAQGEKVDRAEVRVVGFTPT